MVGTIPLSMPGEKLVITGRWENHTTHGPQFRAEFLERLMPDGAAEIERYLASRAVRGIGPRSAARIVARFGAETFEIMGSHPERLSEVPGISAAKAAQIGESFAKQFGMRKLLEFLMAYHLPTELAMPLYKAYGELSRDALRRAPICCGQLFSRGFCGGWTPSRWPWGWKPRTPDGWRRRRCTPCGTIWETDIPFYRWISFREATASMIAVSPEAGGRGPGVPP